MPPIEKHFVCHRALQERDAAVTRWLESEVVPVFDAMQANPSRGRTPDQVAERLRAHHTEKTARAT